MTIAIIILVLINTVAIAYLASVIFEIRDKTNNVYPELIEIFNEQRNIINGILDSMNRWSDLCADIISHIERVEDMEGDIKDIFEWIHSIDDNVANMRMDIQETDTKLGDLMAVHDRDVQDIRKDIQLIYDPLTNGVFTSTRKIERDIQEIKEKLSPEKYNWDDWNKIMVNTAEGNDTDGDIPNDVIRGCSDYPTFLSKKMNTTLEGEDHA